MIGLLVVLAVVGTPALITSISAERQAARIRRRYGITEETTKEARDA